MARSRSSSAWLCGAISPSTAISCSDRTLAEAGFGASCRLTKRAIGSHAARSVPEPAAIVPRRNAAAASVVVHQLIMRIWPGAVVASRVPARNRAIPRIAVSDAAAGALRKDSWITSFAARRCQAPSADADLALDRRQQSGRVVADAVLEHGRHIPDLGRLRDRIAAD